MTVAPNEPGFFVQWPSVDDLVANYNQPNYCLGMPHFDQQEDDVKRLREMRETNMSGGKQVQVDKRF